MAKLLKPARGNQTSPQWLPTRGGPQKHWALGLWAANSLSLANQRGRRKLWRGNLALLLSQGHTLCSGYEVTTVTKSGQGSSLVDRPAEARLPRWVSLADLGGKSRAAATLHPDRAPAPRGRVLTWNAQVGLGRGGRLARRRGTGASPLPTSQTGAHLGDSEGSRALVRPLLATPEGPREGRRRRRRRSWTERQL